MKKLMLFGLLSFLISCNTGEKKTSTDSDSSKMEAGTMETKEAVAYPYPIGYSSQFEVGDSKNAQLILSLWKDFDNNTLDNTKDKFADTITILFSGMTMHGSRDSVLASTKAYRNMYTTVTSTVDAIMAAKSTDKNEDWILVWGTEVHTDKNNKTDSMHLQETWKLNKDGKVDFMMQYQRKPAPPMK